MNIKDFLKLEHPESFDFKDLERDLKSKGCDFEKWLTYKTSPKSFDCDCCTLALTIYRFLWGGGNIADGNRFWQLDIFENREFGGDTMNSMAATLITYIGQHEKRNALVPQKGRMSLTKIHDGFQRREENPNVWKDFLENGLPWGDFARNVGCIGNFVLTPRTFNMYRNRAARDCWDLSLELLRKGDTCLYGDDIWRKKDYEKYINFFFLWDYVDDTGEPIALFEREGEKKLPQVKDENNDFRFMDNAFQVFLEGVNCRIERRGIFMAAMLDIAVNDPNEYGHIRDCLSSDGCELAGHGKCSLETALEYLRNKARLSKDTQDKLNTLKEILKEKPLQ
ncbi:MAG: hypothetical protein HDT33_02740 [Clostridiales bacterium]|nr:hypothetical protein [Clostridiales bacterium]